MNDPIGVGVVAPVKGIVKGLTLLTAAYAPISPAPVRAIMQREVEKGIANFFSDLEQVAFEVGRCFIHTAPLAVATGFAISWLLAQIAATVEGTTTTTAPLGASFAARVGVAEQRAAGATAPASEIAT